MGTIKCEDVNKALIWEQSRSAAAFVEKKLMTIYCIYEKQVLNSSVLIKKFWFAMWKQLKEKTNFYRKKQQPPLSDVATELEHE